RAHRRRWHRRKREIAIRVSPHEASMRLRDNRRCVSPPAVVVLARAYSRFHSSSVSNSRDLLKQLYEAAVAGAATGPVTKRAVEALGIPRDRRVWLLSFGKAAHDMAAAAAASLQRSLNQVVGGLIVAPNDAPPPYGTIAVMAGDHPVPGPRSFAAAQRIGEIAGRMKSGDVALVLVSGGATSLIAGPLRGMSESELTRVFELLLASGLDIGAVNAVRRRFARWGGGRLALAISPAAAH